MNFCAKSIRGFREKRGVDTISPEPSDTPLSYEDKPWVRFYSKNVPEHIEYPEHSVYEFLEQAVQSNPDDPAVIFFDRKTSYASLYDKVCRLASALKSFGVQKGDRVAIYLPNIPQFVVSFFAVQKIGGVCVTFNPHYKETELLHQLNDADIKVVICLDYVMYQQLKKVRAQTSVTHIVVCNVRSELSLSKKILGVATGKIPLPRPLAKEDYDYNELLKIHEPSTEIPVVSPREDIAIIQYTGGTTGVSKGAMLTHFNLVSNVTGLNTWIQPPMQRGKEKFVAVVPLYHVYGLVTCMISAVSVASPLIVIPNPRAGKPLFQDLLETLAKHKPTIFHGVPTLYLALLMHPKIKDYDLTSIRACISGSAPLPIEIMKNFEELTGAHVVEGYGLTETSPITHVNPIDPEALVKPGTIGLPFPDTDIRIFDPSDKERELPYGEEGEIGVRGPQVMKGYWKRDEATKEVMNSQGFFLTGDIAVVDDDGYFTITDRKKDMINAGGMKVYPREVEDVLYEHPAVMEVAVVGVPDSYRGETPKAFIVFHSGERASADELAEFCRTRMAKYKVPKHFEFVDELPKSAVGKILRRVLRDKEWKK